MDRLLRMGAHKTHALSQRMTRGERHGKRRKSLGHGLFGIMPFAAAIEGVADGGNDERHHNPQEKPYGR